VITTARVQCSETRGDEAFLRSAEWLGWVSRSGEARALIGCDRERVERQPLGISYWFPLGCHLDRRARQQPRCYWHQAGQQSQRFNESSSWVTLTGLSLRRWEGGAASNTQTAIVYAAPVSYGPPRNVFIYPIPICMDKHSVVLNTTIPNN